MAVQWRLESLNQQRFKLSIRRALVPRYSHAVDAFKQTYAVAVTPSVPHVYADADVHNLPADHRHINSTGPWHLSGSSERYGRKIRDLDFHCGVLCGFFHVASLAFPW